MSNLEVDLPHYDDWFAEAVGCLQVVVRGIVVVILDMTGDFQQSCDPLVIYHTKRNSVAHCPYTGWMPETLRVDSNKIRLSLKFFPEACELFFRLCYLLDALLFR